MEGDKHDLKRVKLYERIGARWVNHGIALCFGDIYQNDAYLVARAEHNYDQVMLSTKIRPSDVYERQKGMSQ